MKDTIDMEDNMCINESKCRICKRKIQEQVEESLQNAKKQLKRLSESDNFKLDETIRLLEAIDWMENRLEELK